MMTYKLVSFNTISHHGQSIHLYTKDGYPILFYWDCQHDLADELNTNQDLKQSVMNIVNNHQTLYGLLTFNGFIFYIDDHQEEHFEKFSYHVQDIYPLTDDDNSKLVKNKYIMAILNSLYEKTFNKEYKFNDFLFESSIVDIYKKLKDKHGDKINLNTILNYIKSSLLNDYQVNQANCESIVQYIKDILIHKHL